MSFRMIVSVKSVPTMVTLSNIVELTIAPSSLASLRSAFVKLACPRSAYVKFAPGGTESGRSVVNWERIHALAVTCGGWCR